MKNILKISLVFIFCLILVGCGNAQTAMVKSLNSNLDRLNQTVNNISNISTNEIIISNIAPSTVKSEALSASTKTAYTSGRKIQNVRPRLTNHQKPSRQIVKITDGITTDSVRTSSDFGTTYQTRYASGDNYSRVALDNHINELENLYLISSDVVCLNDSLNSTKAQLLEMSSMVKTLNNQINKNTIKLDDNQIKAINELISNLNLNSNRINMTKNEVNNEVNSVKSCLGTYYNNVDLLSSKYIRLMNCLENRLSYYENALSILSEVKNIITKNQTNVIDNSVNPSATKVQKKKINTVYTSGQVDDGLIKENEIQNNETNNEKDEIQERNEMPENFRRRSFRKANRYAPEPRNENDINNINKPVKNQTDENVKDTKTDNATPTNEIAKNKRDNPDYRNNRLQKPKEAANQNEEIINKDLINEKVNKENLNEKIKSTDTEKDNEEINPNTREIQQKYRRMREEIKRRNETNKDISPAKNQQKTTATKDSVNNTNSLIIDVPTRKNIMPKKPNNTNIKIQIA